MRTRTWARCSDRLLCSSTVSLRRSSLSLTGFSKYATAPRFAQWSLYFAPVSPVITRIGIVDVLAQGAKALA